MSTCLEKTKPMPVYVDISEFWPVDSTGEPRSINSVYEDIKNTDLEVGRNTLRLAKDGNLDRGHFANLAELARLCSQWAGREVSVTEILVED